MTTQELIHEFNHKYTNLDEPWPKQYEVDAETYGNVCQSIFDHMYEVGAYYRLDNTEVGQYNEFIRIMIGTKEIMELCLKM